jgi:hypothetical protein
MADYHYEDAQVLAAIEGTDYLKQSIERKFLRGTSGEKWSLYRAIAKLASADLERQLAEMTADRNLWKDDHDGDCPYKTQLAEAKKFHNASQQGAESFLAQTGYSDSRPHSAPSIARLMQDYADLQLAEAKKLAEWTPITPENLPKVGDEIGGYDPAEAIPYWRIRQVTRAFLLGFNIEHCNHMGYTHRRPIAPPQPEKVQP